MTKPRFGLGLATVDGKIYAIGGRNSDGFWGTNEMYDPVTDKWTLRKPMPTPRSFFAIVVYENKIYCIGGNDGKGWDSTNVNEVYDPVNDTWETKTPMPSHRFAMGIGVVNNKIYVIGGSTAGSNSQTWASFVEEYDPHTDSWTKKGDTPKDVANRYMTSTVVNDKIFCVKTVDFNQFKNSSRVDVYDPINNSWSVKAAPLLPAEYASIAITTGINAPVRIYVFSHNLTQVYNPKTDMWSFAAPMIYSKNYTAVAVLDDAIFVVGGANSRSIDNDTKIYSSNAMYKPIGYVAPKIIESPEIDQPTERNQDIESEFPLWIVFPAALFAVLVVIISKTRKHKER